MKKLKSLKNNFDANIPLLDKSDEFPILITTEVLAEGVNLHQANIIINYDVPWNATRLMQRIGRVNRIGTPSEKVYIFNFFPTQRTDSEISKQKGLYKITSLSLCFRRRQPNYSNDESLVLSDYLNSCLKKKKTKDKYY